MITFRSEARGPSLGGYVRSKIEDEEELTPPQEADVSAVGDAFAALNERIDALRDDGDRMADDVPALTRKVYTPNGRVVRLETMVEIAAARTPQALQRFPEK